MPPAPQGLFIGKDDLEPMGQTEMYESQALRKVFDYMTGIYEGDEVGGSNFKFFKNRIGRRC